MAALAGLAAGLVGCAPVVLLLLGSVQELQAERVRLTNGWRDTQHSQSLAAHQLDRAVRIADACVDLYLVRDLACTCFEPLVP